MSKDHEGGKVYPAGSRRERAVLAKVLHLSHVAEMESVRRQWERSPTKAKRKAAVHVRCASFIFLSLYF